jgi:hypothetical protein
LPTVVESSREAREEDDILPEAAGEAEHDRQYALFHKSPGDMSAISGTTARTSHSAQELADLDSTEMLEHLFDLSEKSTSILKALTPTSAVLGYIVEELRKPSSLTSKKVDRLTQEHEKLKEYYGGEHFINNSIALRALLKARRISEIENGPWRPDDIFYQSNLATVLTSLLLSYSRSTPSPIEKFERDFPAPVLSRVATAGNASSIGDSLLLEQTLSIALELRTQFLIQTLETASDQPNFDPDAVLNQIFMGESPFKGWDVDGLRPNQLKKPSRAVIEKRVSQIRRMFLDDPQSGRSGSLVDWQGLYDAFPKAAFVENFIAWTRQRASEIEAQLALHGDVVRIQTALQTEMTRRTENPTSNAAQGEGHVAFPDPDRSDKPIGLDDEEDVQQQVVLRNKRAISSNIK